MSVLVILSPPRERLGARALGREPAPGARVPAEWSYVYSSDGRNVAASGSAATALLPRADHLVLALADDDVSWHRVDVPKAPPARMRAALLGVMEDALLDDDEALLFALGPGALPGQRGWVAVTHRPWLATLLAALDEAGPGVERVVALNQPGETARAHVYTDPADADAAPRLALAHADGACSVALSGGLARSLLPPPEVAVRWTATAAAAAAAEQWLGASVALQSEAERALEAAAAGANLRQFELAPRHRGARALAEAGKRFLSPPWRAARWGLAAIVAVHVVGLNAYAWKLRHAVELKREAMVALLKSSYPGVHAVLDAPLQMRSETERARAAAGKPGPGDLEALLAAAAGAWPDGSAPVVSLRFEPGRLTLAAPGWADAQLAQFRSRLRGAGYGAESANGALVVTPAGVAA
ncbi:MAG: general secretion pathway protein GspL [Burkholderiales bacterium]|nr:general secretion pathway protein GspL [Burkholderiales bacterium]